MKRMTYVKALMCLLFPSAALVTRAQHPVAGDLKCKLTGRMPVSYTHLDVYKRQEPWYFTPCCLGIILPGIPPYRYFFIFSASRCV